MASKDEKANICDAAFDIVIIGAGPAGATLGASLMASWEKTWVGNPGTERRLKVLLVERHPGENYTHYHAKCGEGLSEMAKELISNHVQVVQVLENAIEHWGDAPDHHFQAKGYIIDRARTFRSMIDGFTRSGGTFQNDVFLSALNVTGGCIIAKFESVFKASCRLLVGADGPDSRVRKGCGFEDAKTTTLLQFIVPVQNQTSDAGSSDKDVTVSTEIWYHERYKGGYKYKFPSGKGKAKIGFIHGTDDYNGPQLSVQSRTVAWGGLKTYFKNGILLIGDAAAQCNPITGGGMRSAFYAARYLADKIVKAIVAAPNDNWTRLLQETAARFSAWWRTTPYESKKYVKAHETFERMSTRELERFSNPIREKGLKAMAAFLKNARWWWLYRAFLNADKYSW